MGCFRKRATDISARPKPAAMIDYLRQNVQNDSL